MHHAHWFASVVSCCLHSSTFHPATLHLFNALCLRPKSHYPLMLSIWLFHAVTSNLSPANLTSTSNSSQSINLHWGITWLCVNMGYRSKRSLSYSPYSSSCWPNNEPHLLALEHLSPCPPSQELRQAVAWTSPPPWRCSIALLRASCSWTIPWSIAADICICWWGICQTCNVCSFLPPQWGMWWWSVIFWGMSMYAISFDKPIEVVFLWATNLTF